LLALTPQPFEERNYHSVTSFKVHE